MKTLHVIDVENIFGGPLQGDDLFNSSKELYEQIVTINPCDTVLLASNPELFENLLNSWAYDPIEQQWIGDISYGDLFSKFSDISIQDKINIYTRPGKDGADEILREKALEEIDNFDRIVVASGDHYFKKLCDQALLKNKKLLILSTQHGLSNSLKAIPCEKVTFEIKDTEQAKQVGFKWKSRLGAVA